MNVLYRFSLIQIFVYLFFVPLIRSVFFDVDIRYSYEIAFVFLISFLIGGSLYQEIYVNHQEYKYKSVLKFDFSHVGVLILCLWVVVVAAISIQYGLYDRRIGTEAAADLFSNLPPVVLFAFRALEISLPMLLGVVIVNGIEHRRLRLRDKCLAILLIASFFLLGAASSRSATLLFAITLLAIVQNMIPRQKNRQFVAKFILLGLLAMCFVQISRLGTEDRLFAEYFSAEVMQRLDGLELVSEVVEIHGLQLFGVNLKAAFNPLVSHLFFLEESSALKSAGLTSVKSVVLSEELGSGLRDYNSFVVLDIYYLTGVAGVLCFGFFLGRVSRFVDREINLRGTRIASVFIIAILMNIVILEREFLSIVFSIIRDFFILILISYFFILCSGAPRIGKKNIS